LNKHLHLIYIVIRAFASSALLLCAASLPAQQISLRALVTPSSIIAKDGRPVTFALHGFIEFKSLSELFPYIDSQTSRELLRRGIESRVISMADERPLETLVTHTAQELRQALAQVQESTPSGYADSFLAVQEK
jgi:hypothetical protein